MMNKAIFLDRDGTLIQENGYLKNVDDIQLLDKVVEGLKIFQQRGYLLIVITNQSGVARGYFNEQKVYEINECFKKNLIKKGVKIDDIYYCPHHKEGVIKKYSFDCNCRKPKIGLILEAKVKYNIDLKKSYMIGDKISDIECGANAGCKSVFIKNNNYDNPTKNTIIVSDILEASEKICGGLDE